MGLGQPGVQRHQRRLHGERDEEGEEQPPGGRGGDREVLEGRLRDGTPLKDIPEGGLYPEEIQVFRREEQESLFSG